MYCISIIDSNNRKLEVFSTNSQLKLDNLTTCFDNSDALLIKLGINPVFYKVLVEKKATKESEGTEMSFFDSRYRGIVSIAKDKEKLDKMFKEISKQDRIHLYHYFLNEYITRYENVSNDYDIEMKSRLDNILDTFSEEEEYQRKYGVGNLYTDEKIEDKIKLFFIDQYGKLNYDNFKNMYKFVKFMKNDNSKEELSEKDELELEKELAIIGRKIVKSIHISGKFFNNSKLPIIKEEDNFLTDEPNFDKITDQFDDIDQRMAELDMYMDQERMDLEQKHDYMQKHEKKLFK